ncbi:hypothetical protein D9758_009658 [Tetrapyrgos nigripes]|uniref:Uncharacterized protein n=1 Tax=Tetrapyrgos nigripes TaxID=182062 RepID=A0A8H5CQG3_9AGAR|nr:hypothetical protein D9758_009658 [Tetrapyrgos nigripes]
MLTGAGIECWVAKSSSPSEEIPHGDSTTTVSDEGVTTVRTTVPISANGPTTYHLYWRKAEGAEPQSLWCVVKWESPAQARETVQTQVWMSKSNPEKPLSKSTMGTIRLELQRIKGDVVSKRADGKFDDVEFALEDEDKEKPWCLFIFAFQAAPGSEILEKEKAQDKESREASTEASAPGPPEQKTKKRSRPRVSLKVTEESEDGPPTQKRKTTRNPKGTGNTSPKRNKSARGESEQVNGSSRARRSKKNASPDGPNLNNNGMRELTFAPPPPPPLTMVHRMQSMPPPAQPLEKGDMTRMQSMPPPALNGDMSGPSQEPSSSSSALVSSASACQIRPAPSSFLTYPAVFPGYNSHPPGPLTASDSQSSVPSPNLPLASLSAPPPVRIFPHQSPTQERKSLPPMDFTYVNRELEEAEALLRRQQDESMELDAQIAELTRAQTTRVKEQAARIQAENEAKKRWLQALKQASA